MKQVRVKARVASTEPIAEYAGVRLSKVALEQIAAALNQGGIPMLFDHSVEHPLTATTVSAELVPLADGEYALEAEFSVDEPEWRQVQARFRETGSSGGFSFTITEPQLRPSRPPRLVLSADAAAFSDEVRLAAFRALAADEIVQVNRLYQFSTSDIASVFVEVAATLSLSVVASAIYDGLRALMAGRRDATVIDIQRVTADGTRLHALIKTTDPEVVRTAIALLDDQSRTPVQRFDSTAQLWLPPGSESHDR